MFGAFYQQADRDYSQTLPTPGYDQVLPRGNGAPVDTPDYSRLTYDFSQFAAFGEATWRFSPSWALTGGLRYYISTKIA